MTLAAPLPSSTMLRPLWLVIGTLCVAQIAALPIQMTVNQRANECIYESLGENEAVTISAFVLSGAELKATLTFAGPVASLGADTALDLQDEIARFDAGHHDTDNVIEVTEVVDFEHLSLGELNYRDGDDDDEDDDGTATAEERKERRAQRRKRALENRKKREDHSANQKKKIREEGEPYQRTFRVTTPGWYRFCVQGTWYQVVAEVDMRKETELGGVGESGHVFTFEEKAIAEEDKLMEEDTANEEGIKDEDFSATKDKLKVLRRLLAEISTKQQQERHRLIVHAATNEHSHSRMVLGSLLETILFMVVTGVQIMTIRRWFKGAPVLGR